MDSGRKERAEHIASVIRKRWGSKALDTLGKATPKPRVQAISTGFAELNSALGIGGIPQGHITELWGTPTSGKVTLALKIVSNAQAQGEMVAYLDLSESLDPDYVARSGVDLNKMLIFRPQPKEKIPMMLHDLVEKRGAGLIVVDCFMSDPKSLQKLKKVLRRTGRVLSGSTCTLVFLTPSSIGILSYEASVGLSIKRHRWLERHRDIYGYVSKVLIAKNIFAPSGREVELSFDFDETVLGDAA